MRKDGGTRRDALARQALATRAAFARLSSARERAERSRDAHPLVHAWDLEEVRLLERAARQMKRTHDTLTRRYRELKKALSKNGETSGHVTRSGRPAVRRRSE